MEYIGIIIGVVGLSVICLALVLKFKQNKDVVSSTLDITNEEKSDWTIHREMISAETITNPSRLVEITDGKILANINRLVPGLAQIGNAVGNATQAIQTNGEVLYRAIIPAGTKLTDSKGMENAVRGIYHGADGIKGHADLLAVPSQKGASVAANTAVMAMGVAAMVVGQYYMTQIDAELVEISNELSKVSEFQDNEYRSRVFSLIAHVKKIADFHVEILDSNELRSSKITQLDSLEQETTQLLGQANLTLAGYTKKKVSGYESYEKEIEAAQNWYMYQKSLMDVLHKISDLRYTLHMGRVSREQCIALHSVYNQQVIDTQEKLANWHHDTTNRLSIDIDEIRRKREGVKSVVYFIPGLFNEELRYTPIPQNIANMIAEQTIGFGETQHNNTSDLYAEDVQLIVREGKVYYLPETE